MVFISDRDDGVAQLFVVPLARQTEDPNDPLVRERLKKAAASAARRTRRAASRRSAPDAGPATRQPPRPPSALTVDTAPDRSPRGRS